MKSDELMKQDVKKFVDQFDVDKEQLKKQFPQLYYYLLALKDDFKISHLSE